MTRTPSQQVSHCQSTQFDYVTRLPAADKTSSQKVALAFNAGSSCVSGLQLVTQLQKKGKETDLRNDSHRARRRQSERQKTMINNSANTFFSPHPPHTTSTFSLTTTPRLTTVKSMNNSANAPRTMRRARLLASAPPGGRKDCTLKMVQDK